MPTKEGKETKSEILMHKRVDINSDLVILKCRLSEEEHNSLYAMIWSGGEGDIYLAKEAINAIKERL